MLAGAALMIDYLLNVAVGISAGIGALVSAVPSLLPHTLALCLAVLVILTIVNLRGVKEAGTAFVAPTYLFVGTLVVVILIGFYKVVVSGGHPVAIVAPPGSVGPSMQLVGVWILVKAFASGCTALTGVEDVYKRQQHDHVNAGPRQQKPRNHPRRSAARHAAAS